MCALLGADESGIYGVYEQIRTPLLSGVTVETSGIEQPGELTPAVLPVKTGVLIDLVEAYELGITWRVLVYVTRLVTDTYDITLLYGMLYQ